MKYDMRHYRELLRYKTIDQKVWVDDYIAEFQELPKVVEIPKPIMQAEWYVEGYLGFKRLIKRIYDYIR